MNHKSRSGDNDMRAWLAMIKETCQSYDVIVVGSGITGGWAAKEFCEKGFNTLVIERGRNIEHRGTEYKDMQSPWMLQNRNLGTEKYDEEGRYQLFKKKFGRYRPEMMHFFADDESDSS